MPVKKLALALFIATIVTLYFVGGGEKYFSIDLYQNLFEKSPVSTAAVFFTVFGRLPLYAISWNERLVPAEKRSLNKQ